MNRERAVRVAVRCRPESIADGASCVTIDDPTIAIRSGEEEAVFMFDKTFGRSTSQLDSPAKRRHNRQRWRAPLFAIIAMCAAGALLFRYRTYTAFEKRQKAFMYA